MAAIKYPFGKLEIWPKVNKAFTFRLKHAVSGLVLTDAVVHIKVGLTSDDLHTLTVGAGVTVVSGTEIAFEVPALPKRDYYDFDMLITAQDGRQFNVVDKIFPVYG